MYKIDENIKCECCNDVIEQSTEGSLHFACFKCGAEWNGLKISKTPDKPIIPLGTYDLIPISNTEISIFKLDGKGETIHKGQRIDTEKYILIEE